MYYFVLIAYILICIFLIAAKGMKGGRLSTGQGKLAISLSILALLLIGAAVYFNFKEVSYFVVVSFFVYCCLLFLIIGGRGAKVSRSQRQMNTTFILVMMLLLLFSFIIYFTLKPGL